MWPEERLAIGDMKWIANVRRRLSVRLTGLFLACGLLFGLWTSALAEPFIEAANYLSGVWQGDGYTLRVDASRAQASVDGARPFAWSRFLVKEVDGDEIVFSVGAEIFEARVNDLGIVLTSTVFRGERNLQRETAEP